MLEDAINSRLNLDVSFQIGVLLSYSGLVMEMALYLPSIKNV